MPTSTSIVRPNPTRVVVITLGLSAAGAILGGLAGAAALAIGILLSAGPHRLALWILAIPALLGMGLGAICAPIAGWLLLREVPLGRAFRGLTVGTVVGGIAGWLLHGPFHSFYGPIATAAVGFLSAAVLLRVRTRRARRLVANAGAPSN